MPSYRYRAVAPDGAGRRGTLSATSPVEARQRLEREGWLALEVRESPVANGGFGHAARRDLAVVFRALAELVEAGVPIERAVHTARGVARGPLRDMLGRAQAELAEGRALSQALGAVPGILPPAVAAALQAGERAGRLAAVLGQVASDLESEAELLAQVRQALAYPLLLAVAGSASVVLLGAVVLPRFAQLLDEVGVTLPLSTRLLLDVSAALTRWWWVSPSVVMLLVLAAHRVAGRAGGLSPLHRAMLRLPVVGPIRLGVATARALRALAAALAAGSPMLTALRAAALATADAELGRRLARVEDRVRRGEPLAPSLTREAALAPMALQLVQVGEASGRLPVLCERAASLAAADALRRLRVAVALLEPLLILAFGVVIAAIAAALLQAVYALRPS